MASPTTGMIVCRRPSRVPIKPCSHPSGCERPGAFLCDFPDGEDTCDNRFCQPFHGRRVASEIDYCWEHQEETL